MHLISNPDVEGFQTNDDQGTASNVSLNSNDNNEAPTSASTALSSSSLEEVGFPLPPLVLFGVDVEDVEQFTVLDLDHDDQYGKHANDEDADTTEGEDDEDADRGARFRRKRAVAAPKRYGSYEFGGNFYDDDDNGDDE